MSSHRPRTEAERAAARERARDWYLANKPRALANVKAYKRRNKTACAIYDRLYFLTNGDRIRFRKRRDATKLADWWVNKLLFRGRPTIRHEGLIAATRANLINKRLMGIK